jgi:hypothetical protein
MNHGRKRLTAKTPRTPRKKQTKKEPQMTQMGADGEGTTEYTERGGRGLTEGRTTDKQWTLVNRERLTAEDAKNTKMAEGD